ncbi:hypothetical protein K474DRAFT_690038 [Panus rudis PR-1116 ss-1]|nr:hypothetical protein K474DRAFT_690038 [Panus rudis PR-1116 ss-1]
MALIALVVFVIVPVVRRRRARKLPRDLELASSARTSERKPSLLSYLSRRSPFRHHKRKSAGPETMLPLLPPLSTFTWSDLLSHNQSTETVADDGMEQAEVQSFPTDQATMSHHSKYDWYDRSGAIGERPQPARSVYGHESAQLSAPGWPSPQRSPSPPGLPSKASSDHHIPTQDAFISAAFPYPSSPQPVVQASSTSLPPATGMDPAHAAKPSKHSRTRPASVQLPSPPASPPLAPPGQPANLTRSRSTRSGSVTTLPQADLRFSSSRLRPPLITSHSTPTALPFRPPASGVVPPSSWTPSTLAPATPSLHPSISPSPLTKAFRTDLMGAESRSSSGGDSSSVRYPSITQNDTGAIPSSISRRRSGSTASEFPPSTRTHLEPRYQTPETLRRASVSTNPYGQQSYHHRPLPSVTSSTTSLALGGRGDVGDGSGSASSSRAYLRMSASHHTTPQYEEAHTSRGESGALSYFEARPHPSSNLRHDASADGGTHAQSSSTVQSTQRTLAPGIRPLPIPPGPPTPVSATEPSSASRQPPPSTPLSRSSSRSSQPALVRRKDSNALRPLPMSPFLNSPPTSPPVRPVAYSRSRQGSVSSLHSVTHKPYSSRSRAGSVITLPEPLIESNREDKASDEGSSDTASRRSVQAALPPLGSFSTLDLGGFDSRS